MNATDSTTTDDGQRTTVGLPEFLLARFDEDERRARMAGNAKFYVTEPPLKRAYIEVEAERVNLPIDTIKQCELWEHFAYRTPGRTLAECEAKRRIVDDAMALGPDGRVMFPSRQHGYVMRCLALPYADHPDYREEWRP